MSTPVMQPPPDVAAAVPDVSRTMKERVLGGIGGILSAGVGEDPSSSPLQKEMERQHGIRLATARRHYENWVKTGAMLGTGEIDPATGQPTGTNPDGTPMTPQQRQEIQAMHEGAYGDYQKAAGVSKEAKASLERHKGLMDLLVNKGHKALQAVLGAHRQVAGEGGGGAQGGAGGAQQPGGMSGPPAAGAPAGKPMGATGAPSGGLTPPPAPTGGAPAGEEAAAQIPRMAQEWEQGRADKRALALKQKEQDIVTQGKIQEDKAKAAAGGGAHLQHVSVFNPATGETELGSYNPSTGKYTDQNGNVIEGAELAPRSFNYTGPDGQPLKGWMVGSKLFDQEMKPLPPGTKVFSAWMQPLTTTTESYRSEPQPDGSIKLVPVETTSTRTRGLPPPPEPGAGKPAKVTAPSKSTASGASGGRTVGGKVPPGVAKAYEAYNGAQERFAVMQDALPRALQGDQQAMLNLLANHVGMTMGLQKGARITQGVYSEAEQSAPILQRIDARFDKDGYLTGVVLTPEQMRQMIDLAKVRLDQDKAAWQREIGAAKTGYGMTPPPTPKGSSPKSSGPAPKTAGEYLDSIGVPH